MKSYGIEDHVGKQRRCTQYVCLALLATPLASNVPLVPWAQNSRGRHLREVGEPQNEDEVSVVGPRLSRGTDGPKGRAVGTGTYFQHRKKEMAIKETRRTQETYRILFHLCYFLVFPNHLNWMWWQTEKERKTRATLAAFACSLTHQ